MLGDELHNPTLPDASYAEVSIPSGNEGIKATLKIMRRWVKAYRRNPQIIALAQSLLSAIPNESWSAEVSALHRYVRDNIRYMLDVNEVEVLQSPTHLLQTRAGDCDDMALLLATLLEASGHPARFVAVGFDAANLSHVLVEAKIGETWTPLECTKPVNMGWYPPAVNIHFVQSI